MIKVLCEQGSEAWHQAKLGLITGTRFATLMSGKSTKGYKDLLLTIAGEIISGEKEDTYTNEIMERGIEMEGEAADYYSELLDVKLEEVGLCAPDIDNEFEEWVGISPDRLIGDDGGLEIKCPLLKTHLGYMQSGKLPSVYKWQVQGALFVTGRKYWDFMSYYPDVKPFIIRVLPDKDMHKELEQRLREAIVEIREILSTYKKYSVV